MNPIKVESVKEKNFKLYFLLGIIFLLFIYLISKIYILQIKNGEKYKNEKISQNVFLEDKTERGGIFATRKDGELIPLAYDEVVYKLVLSPKDINIEDVDFIYNKLKDYVSIDKEEFKKKALKKNDPYEELMIVSVATSTLINDLYLPGVHTYKTYKRSYPLKEVGARVIGFSGEKQEDRSGKYGLEKYYDKDLSSGEESSRSYFMSLMQEISNGNNQNKSSNKKNIVTSLEPNVMIYLHKLLEKMKNEWEADTVSAIIIEPKTGKIIAMDTYPSFDPNNYSEYSLDRFNNPNVQSVFELGSIMKPITLSGGLEKKLIKPTTIYKDYGFVKVNEYTIKNFDEKARGDVNMQEVISQSLNTGAVYVMKLLGRENFLKNFYSFKFDGITGIDLPNETFNITSNLEGGQDVEYATASFGQGVAISPISMLRALTIIANNGLNLYPQLAYAYLKKDGDLEYMNILREEERIISTTTASTMTDMLVELIDTGLAKGRYKDENYKVAAKTGTAQLPSPDGKYYKDKFIHSYFTFFPSTDPKFAVLIYQVNPKKGYLASITLAPSATELKDFLLNYYNIPPDR